MLARLAILMLAAGVFLQPILAVVPGAEDCCATQAATPSAFAVQADEHQCCCCEADDATGQSAPSDHERPDQRPRGCDCPKSCCTSIVKVPLGVAPRARPPYRGTASSTSETTRRTLPAIRGRRA